MRQISGCNGGVCPAVWELDDGSLIVQGPTRPGAGPGESRVAVPRAVFLEAADTLQQPGAAA